MSSRSAGVKRLMEETDREAMRQPITPDLPLLCVPGTARTPDFPTILSFAGQDVTTVGGVAGGRVITNGGFNSNLAAGAFSQTDQQVVTLDGSAGGRLNSVSSGANCSAALGFGSSPPARGSAGACCVFHSAQGEGRVCRCPERRLC